MRCATWRAVWHRDADQHAWANCSCLERQQPYRSSCTGGDPVGSCTLRGCATHGEHGYWRHQADHHVCLQHVRQGQHM